jgi:hypothetical protein
MSYNTDFGDFEDSLLDLLAAEQPAKVVLASVHRPTFSQQLTFLHSQRPGLTGLLPAAVGQAAGRKSALREITPQ